MNLLEMVNFVCGKVNQTDAEDKARCKEFLQRRFTLIWAEALWKDAIVSYTQTLDPDLDNYTPGSTYLPSKGVLLVAPIIERVMAVRSTSGKLNVQRPEFFYRVDVDAFARTGSPTEFMLLPPCVWEFNTAIDVDGTLANAGDADLVLTVDLLDEDGIGLSRYAITMDTGTSPKELTSQSGPTERIDAILKKTTTGAVFITPATGTFTLVNDSADSWDVSFGNAVDAVVGEAVATIEPGEQVTLTRTDDFLLLIAPFSGGVAEFGVAVDEGFSGTITFDGADFTTEAPDPIFSLLSADTGGKLRQRIRLVDIPSDSLTVRILGKRACPTFTNDLDVPALTGVDNCLLAFAHADMLERERQYGKAKLKVDNEALPLLEQLKANEAVQQAHNLRIIPENGYGDDYGYVTGKADL